MSTFKKYIPYLSKKEYQFNIDFLPSSKSHEFALIGMVLSTVGEFVTLPVNFNVDEHIAAYPPESNGFTSSLKKFQEDKVCHILGLLSSIPARNKDLISDDGYVPLYTPKLNEPITDYAAYLEYLRATNVIEWKDDGDCSKGKARRYRWKEPYFSAEFVKVPTPKYLNLIQKGKVETVEEFRRNRSREIENDCPQYLLHWYNTNKLKMNSERASKFAFELKKYRIAQGVESWDWNRDKGCYKHPQNQYLAIMENINSISGTINDYKVQVDDHVHRLHSVLTNMQKEFRNFLTYDGQPLVSIDIKNSQPYLSCILFNPAFWTENSTLDLSLNTLPQNIRDSIRFTPPRAGSISINTALNKFFRKLEGHEFDRYKSIVSEGAMYETIMQWILDEKRITIERDDAKTIIFKLFFSPNRTNPEDENHWLMLYFKEKFPQVVELFKIIKKNYQGLDEKKQHGRLACLLQSIESEIILIRCCQRIWDEKPAQVPIFTIHDSIVTTLVNKDYVKRIMEEELTRAIGVTPRLSEEYWRIEALQEKYPFLLNLNPHQTE